jgi:hypothetical protein
MRQPVQLFVVAKDKAAPSARDGDWRTSSASHLLLGCWLRGSATSKRAVLVRKQSAGSRDDGNASMHNRWAMMACMRVVDG